MPCPIASWQSDSIRMVGSALDVFCDYKVSNDQQLAVITLPRLSMPYSERTFGARPDHGIGISHRIRSAATQFRAVNLIDQFLYER
jgi:hypothetical protein